MDLDPVNPPGQILAYLCGAKMTLWKPKYFHKEGSMNGSQIRTALAITVILLLATTALAGACPANPGVLPPNAQPQDRSYGEWSAQWWKFVLELPADKNPVPAGPTECATYRVGDVMLVAVPSLMYGVELHCEAPVGSMIFLEVLDAECSTLEPPPFNGANQEELTACARSLTPTDLQASIDGVPIEHPQQYISVSPMYDFVVPANNVLGVRGSQAGKSVAYGAYLMLAPLKPGAHSIHTHGVYADLGFTADRDLTLTVTRPH